jgi:cobalamin synthase
LPGLGLADVSGDGLSRVTRYFPLVAIIVGALAASMFSGTQLLFSVGIAIGPRSNSAWLYVVATAPPHTGLDIDVRSQL